MKKQALWFNTGLPMIVDGNLCWSLQPANFHADIIEGSNKIQYPNQVASYKEKLTMLENNIWCRINK